MVDAYSLVPRLLCSGMRNWTCACGESLVFFSHVSTAEGRMEVERPQLRGEYPRLRTGKRAKVVANLLHVSSYHSWISYTASVECIVRWTTCKMLTFCFSPISITSCYIEKMSGSPHVYNSHSRRAWERGLMPSGSFSAASLPSLAPRPRSKSLSQ